MTTQEASTPERSSTGSSLAFEGAKDPREWRAGQVNPEGRVV